MLQTIFKYSLIFCYDYSMLLSPLSDQIGRGLASIFVFFVFSNYVHTKTYFQLLNDQHVPASIRCFLFKTGGVPQLLKLSFCFSSLCFLWFNFTLVVLYVVN